MRTLLSIATLIVLAAACASRSTAPPPPAPVASPAPEPVTVVSTPAPETPPPPPPPPSPLPAPAPQPQPAPPSVVNIAEALRQADALAASGRTTEAATLYGAVARSPSASREAIAAAATGLYRTGDFAGAAAAFGRLGTFLRGEEDLRFYDAVSLYETGRYDEARRQLDCAIPFLQITDEIARYRAKIEARSP